MTIDTYTLHRGTSPLLISFPHVGTEIPGDQQVRYTQRALASEDTDWFLDRVYSFAAGLGATLIVPRFSRYLIDLNRSSDNAPMYPGQNNTELVPTRHFSGDELYRANLAPDDIEIERRILHYWHPYHDALRTELAQIRRAHGHAVLFDAHSIKSELPWLFDGRLPHMSIGTASGGSCAASLRDAVTRVFAAQSDFSHVVDARFKGGHITRHFGQPNDGVHAVQLEMCWRAYMNEEPPYEWNEARAGVATPLLVRFVETLIRWVP